MNKLEIENIASKYIGMRIKDSDNSIILYANAYTLTIDMFKWLKKTIF